MGDADFEVYAVRRLALQQAVPLQGTYFRDSYLQRLSENRVPQRDPLSLTSGLYSKPSSPASGLYSQSPHSPLSTSFHPPPSSCSRPSKGYSSFREEEYALLISGLYN